MPMPMPMFGSPPSVAVSFWRSQRGMHPLAAHEIEVLDRPFLVELYADSDDERAERGAAYAEKALAEEVDAVRSAPSSMRNRRLFRAAAALFELVAGDLLEARRVEADLTIAARAAGLGDDEIRNTLRSGERAGRRRPRRLPDSDATAKVINIENSRPYPSSAAVSVLWELGGMVNGDDEVRAWLTLRGLDPDLVADLDIMRVLPSDLSDAQLEEAASEAGFESPSEVRSIWPSRGHRVMTPMRDEMGDMRSLRFKRPNEGSLSARGRSVGLVMTCPVALQMLRTGSWAEGQVPVLVITEGEVDTASQAAGWSDAADNVPACIGIVSGSWTQALADRIPSGTTLVIATDADQAGDDYATKIARTCASRVARNELRIQRFRPHGEDVSDINDMFVRGMAGVPVSGGEPFDLPEKDDPAPGEAQGHEASTPAGDRDYQPKRTTRSAVPAPGTLLTDLGNAERLVLKHGQRLCYVGAQKKWYAWDGTRWALDDTGEVYRAAVDTIRAMYAEAATLTSSKKRAALVGHAIRSEDGRRINAMVSLAETHAAVVARAQDFDQKEWLLNTPSGTVDLHTGKLQPHSIYDLITKITTTPYEPDAACPAWEAFLLSAMAGNTDMVGFLQRAIGYSLTGSVKEHAMFFLHGSGGNGKGTFVNTVLRTLGDYARPGAPNLLLEKKGEAHPTEQADLWGARLVSVQEVDDGRAWAESTLKALTGGDPIKARRMREDFWSFEPSHKFWVSGNYKPRVKGRDDGIWRRIRLIPFDVSFVGRENKELGVQLEAEAPGILAWAVRGCLEWQRTGLAEPEHVKNSTARYRMESDDAGVFLAEACEFHEDGRLAHDDLRRVYSDWCWADGKEPDMDKLKSALLRAAAQHGINLTAGSVRNSFKKPVRGWQGVRLKPQEQPTGGITDGDPATDANAEPPADPSEFPF